ncbi:hypothetical protein KDW_06690 [Dictyobacter vulcani]|uniref:Uncharacterized protein n=1 Tax=Dictyobacter vulcani TaxID=2607529 RepID=A0A5J4KJA6_9CHLR|nr:hypothetical protein [Dictyobacter vulcani]GER86507.1 hypothetical protein KDW_06690 [Dictyobacter vulcani]
MTTESTDDKTTAPVDETAQVQEGTGAAIHVPTQNTWYRYFNEDWLATLFGLLLVILLVVGLLHSIP